MKTIKLEAARERDVRTTDHRHRLVFGGLNMDTVIHLSDDELDRLRDVVAEYNAVTRESVEL